MKKSGISRRGFIRGLTTGTLSATVIPSWAWEQHLTYGSNKTTKGSEQGVTSLQKLFDCNKYLGPGFPQRPDFPGVPDLLAHMDRLGIDRAVAWHTAARDLHPMAGNEQLLREIHSACARERIIPSFIISPAMIDDPGVMDRFQDLVMTHRIRAFHYFPKKYGWSLPGIAPVIRAILTFKPVLFLDSFESLDKNLDDIISFSGGVS